MPFQNNELHLEGTLMECTFLKMTIHPKSE